MSASDTDAGYNAFDDDLPTVQMAIGRDQPGLVVDGTFYSLFELPERAAEAYKDFVQGGGRPGGIGQTKVHECEKCAERDDGYAVGYLTTSDNIGDYKSPYTCSHTWREESTSMNGATAGRFAPHPWRVDLKINGEDSRVIDGDDADRTYTLTVTRREEYGHGADVLGETTVELPAEDTTITGETDGQSWEADVEIRDETACVDWRRVDEDGETVRYAYRETEGMEHRNPNEKLGLLPVPELEDVDGNGEYLVGPGMPDARTHTVDGEEIIVRDLATTAKSRVSERECGSTDFQQVHPNSTLVDEDDLVPVHALTADQVPNAKSHLSRIQGQVSNSISRDEFLKEVAVACRDFWEEYGYPDDHPKAE